MKKEARFTVVLKDGKPFLKWEQYDSLKSGKLKAKILISDGAECTWSLTKNRKENSKNLWRLKGRHA